MFVVMIAVRRVKVPVMYVICVPLVTNRGVVRNSCRERVNVPRRRCSHGRMRHLHNS